MTAPVLPGVLASISPYLDRYGYGAVGVLLLLENFGMPVPGEAVLVAASVYAGAGRLNITVVAVIGFAAAVMGDSIGWLIGCHGGRRLLARWGKYVLLTPSRVARAEKFFVRHSSKIVPFARFIDGLRQANGIIAGMTGMRFPRFLALNAIGAALWVGAWATAGDLAGQHIATLYPTITRYSLYEFAALGAVVAILLARAAVQHHSRSSSRADHASAPETPDQARDRAAFHRD
jgi:membrane protein DedA with SNARE-associated domain